MRRFFILVFLTILSRTMGASAWPINEILNEIKGINLSGVTITKIEEVPAGNLSLPGWKTITDLPAFVRVAFTSKPTPDSNIHSELWMPEGSWNGRFLGTGNGGGAGQISYGALIDGVRRGFATANTDMGTSPNADAMAGHPERWADFGYRSTHEMTVAAKAILQVYYKRSASHDYFTGCSTGGQQALMEAQRYPDDYDGIIAGAPANNRTHLHTSFIWNLIANNQGDDHEIISQKKMELFSHLVIKNCNSQDGGAPGDNFLTDPRLCIFDPAILPQCADGTETDSCFSQAEIAALKKIYDGPTNPGTGERIYAPLPFGGTHLESTEVHLYLFKWVFGSDFDYTKFDFDQDMEKVDSVLAPLLNANDPDLRRMKNRGGKILMYSGTEDQLVPFPDAVNYYERVVEAQGGLEQTRDFFRFFLVPGMAHCGGGPGLSNFGQGIQDTGHDVLTALMDWVEKGIAPDEFTGSGYDPVNKVRFERPIYPYPMVPEYTGGDPTSPSSYRGVIHQRGGVQAPDPKYLK